MGVCVPAKFPGTDVGRVGPVVQDGHRATALACFLIILSGPQVGENFKKTVS